MPNGYYTIEKARFSSLPKIEKSELIGRFARLFDGACHIAEDINKRYGKKVLEAIQKENKNAEFAKNW